MHNEAHLEASIRVSDRQESRELNLTGWKSKSVDLMTCWCWQNRSCLTIKDRTINLLNSEIVILDSESIIIFWHCWQLLHIPLGGCYQKTVYMQWTPLLQAIVWSLGAMQQIHSHNDPPVKLLTVNALNNTVNGESFCKFSQSENCFQ